MAVGTVVRVLEVPESVLARLSGRERTRVASMCGQAFTVYEVDSWGGAWVEKWWSDGKGKRTSHSVGLKPAEIQVVHKNNRGKTTV